MILNINALIALITSLLISTCVYFDSIAIFLIGRVLSGIQYGITVVNVNLYIVEITPLRRGWLYVMFSWFDCLIIG